MVQLLLLLHVDVTHAVAVNQDSITALTSYMIQTHAKSSVIFGCWKKAGKIQYCVSETNTTAYPSSRMWLLSFSLSQCVTRLKWIQFTSFNPISLNPILILSSPLFLLFQVVPLPQVFKPKLCMHVFSSMQAVWLPVSYCFQIFMHNLQLYESVNAVQWHIMYTTILRKCRLCTKNRKI